MKLPLKVAQVFLNPDSRLLDYLAEDSESIEAVLEHLAALGNNRIRAVNVYETLPTPLMCGVSAMVHFADSHPGSSGDDGLMAGGQGCVTVLLGFANKKFIKIEASKRGPNWQNKFALVEDDDLATATNSLSRPTSKVVKAEDILNIIVKNYNDQSSEFKQDDKAMRLWLSGIFHELEDKGMVSNVMERVEAIYFNELRPCIDYRQLNSLTFPRQNLIIEHMTHSRMIVFAMMNEVRITSRSSFRLITDLLFW